MKLRIALGLSIVVAFFVGGAVNGAVTEPTVEYVPVEDPQVEVVTEVITIEAERIVEKVVEVPVEVEVEVPIKLREFESTEELESWLEENHIDEAVMLYASGKKFDCDDYARRLIKDAGTDGFQLWLQVLLPDYRHPDTGERITKRDEAHALCSAIIGNKLYFIEPQTDEYWFVADVD